MQITLPLRWAERPARINKPNQLAARYSDDRHDIDSGNSFHERRPLGVRRFAVPGRRVDELIIEGSLGKLDVSD
jgi:hypothetical protein